jgi:hypothetical protein
MTMTLSEVPAAPVVARPARPLERLEAEIVELSSQLTAARSRLLGLVAEFDAVEGGGSGGCARPRTGCRGNAVSD